MKEFFRTYFSQKQLLFYMILNLSLILYTISNGSLIRNWTFLLGIILLSPFIEYFVHKYVLHFPKFKGKLKFLSNFMDKIHYLHHHDPKKVDYIFAQIWLTLPPLVFYSSIVLFLTKSIENTSAFMVYLISYYLIYEWFHYMAHANYNPKNFYSKYMKKYHVWHHYKNEEYWYGITNPIADIIFGKFKNPKSVEKSENVKNWLLAGKNL